MRTGLIRRALLLLSRDHAVLAATAARRMRLAAGALARRAASLAARAAAPAAAAALAQPAPLRAYATLTTEQVRTRRKPPDARTAATRMLHGARAMRRCCALTPAPPPLAAARRVAFGRFRDAGGGHALHSLVRARPARLLAHLARVLTLVAL